MYVKDLKNQIGVSGPHPMLHCLVCDGEYSANAGDYFLSKPTTVLDCCGVELELVIKKTVYVRLRKGE